MTVALVTLIICQTVIILYGLSIVKMNVEKELEREKKERKAIPPSSHSEVSKQEEERK